MNKKFFVSFAIVLCAIFSFTVCFANNDGIGNDLGQARNDIRNFVGGVESTVENAAKDVSNTSKNLTGDVENGMDKDNDNDDGFMGSMDDNNGRYSATRTSTDNTVLGMSSTAWTWLIVGIAAIAIIALIWYYSMQFTNTNTHHDD